MYIEPNTSIYILKGVPLDPTYDHTIYWSYPTDQVSYFLGKAKHTLTRQMYQRSNRGSMRIKKKAEELYDCNYLMFQNTAFGNKWFFAFITSVNYINNEVSEVNYQIDVMQTYHFDYVLKPCFVEREHSETDNIGDNLVPENIDIGDLVNSNSYAYIPDIFLNLDLVYWLSKDALVRPKGYADPLTASVGGYRPKIFPYLRNGVFQTQSVSDAVDWYYNAISSTADVVSIVPSYWVENWNNGYGSDGDPSQYNRNEVLAEIPIGYSMPKSDNTTIKNNKCFTYPYYFLYATNSQGTNQSYKLEWLGSSVHEQGGNLYATFAVKGEVAPNCTVIFTPMAYLNSVEMLTVFDFSISTTFNIFVSVNEDIFKIWLGQRASSAMLPAAFAGQQMIEVGQARGSRGAKHFKQSAKHFENEPKHFANNNPEWLNDTDSILGNGGWGAVIGMLSSGLDTLLNGHGGLPGNQGSFSLLTSPVGNVPCGIEFSIKHLSPEYATIVDGYFTRYGYACHKLKIPNRNSRPEFNFVKTVDCLIEASDLNGYGMPADDEATICDIYNNGITFWKNPAHIGDYTVNNAPTNQ